MAAAPAAPTAANVMAISQPDIKMAIRAVKNNDPDLAAYLADPTSVCTFFAPTDKVGFRNVTRLRVCWLEGGGGYPIGSRPRLVLELAVKKQTGSLGTAALCVFTAMSVAVPLLLPPPSLSSAPPTNLAGHGRLDALVWALCWQGCAEHNLHAQRPQLSCGAWQSPDSPADWEGQQSPDTGQ